MTLHSVRTPITSRRLCSKRIMKPEIPDLFYAGLGQPLPTLVNFAEQQSKLIAAYLAGTYTLPPADEMNRDHRGGQRGLITPGIITRARRHTIQLDVIDAYARAI